MSNAVPRRTTCMIHLACRITGHHDHLLWSPDTLDVSGRGVHIGGPVPQQGRGQPGGIRRFEKCGLVNGKLVTTHCRNAAYNFS